MIYDFFRCSTVYKLPSLFAAARPHVNNTIMEITKEILEKLQKLLTRNVADSNIYVPRQGVMGSEIKHL